MGTEADRAIAAVPVSEPRSGRAIGVVALMCAIEAKSDLMVPYLRRIRREIEDSLLNDGSTSERALTGQFVRVRRHARGAVVALNEHMIITNAAAARLVDEADRPALWEWARGAIANKRTDAGEVRLSRGIIATVRCEPVEAGGEVVGALLRLGARSRGSSDNRGRRGTRQLGRPTLGWASLSPAQLGIAELVTTGLTNPEIAAHLYVSRHTVDFHLRQIFSKLSIESRVELARIVSERQAARREAS
jgi:DNA-binding CsgD family transcriptional regulator